MLITAFGKCYSVQGRLLLENQRSRELLFILFFCISNRGSRRLLQLSGSDCCFVSKLDRLGDTKVTWSEIHEGDSAESKWKQILTWESWRRHVFIMTSPPVWLVNIPHPPVCRLRAHVAARTKLPILIFPEGQSQLGLGCGGGELGGYLTIFSPFAGTCINNTSVMMFKKGSFEIGGTIYPVTIKVSKSRGGDPAVFFS